MKKLMFGIALCAMIAASVFAGGSKQESSSASKDGKVHIKVALFNDGQALTASQKAIFDAFVKDNPNIIPEFQFITSDSYGQNWNGFLMKIQTMIASGNAPDVISLGLEGVGFMVMNDIAQPINAYAAAHPEELKAIQIQGVDKELQKIFEVDGKLYGYPYEANSVVTHIRKDIFQQAGVPLPKENWTWDDFKKICDQIVSKTDSFAFAVPTNFFCLQALLYSNGAAPLNNTWDAAAINSPESVEMFQFLQDAIYKYKWAPVPSQTVTETDLVIQGKAAMQFIGRWVSNDYNASELYDKIYAQLVPAGKAGNITCAGDACFVVRKGTPHPDEAMKVAIWCAGPQWTNIFLKTGSLPANEIFGSEVMKTDRTMENWQCQYTVYNKGLWRRSQDPPEYADLANIYGKYMDIIYTNQMPAKQALDQAAAEINQVFKESKFRKTPEQMKVINSLFKN